MYYLCIKSKNRALLQKLSKFGVKRKNTNLSITQLQNLPKIQRELECNQHKCMVCVLKRAGQEFEEVIKFIKPNINDETYLKNLTKMYNLIADDMLVSNK